MKKLLFATCIAAALLISCSDDDSSTDSGSRAAATPSNPNPPHQAIEQPTSVTLTWQCSGPGGDQFTYDVYLGTSTSPPKVADSLSSRTYAAHSLLTNTTYHWRVEARNPSGSHALGPLWTFATGSGLTQLGTFTTRSLIQDVAVAGSTAYIADETAGLYIVNMSNPTQPILLGRYDGLQYTFRVVVDGSYAYLMGRSTVDRSNGITVLDVSNPAIPQAVGHWDTTAQATLGPIYIAKQGDYIYSAADGGLMVFDVATPSSPARVGWRKYVTAGLEPTDVAVSGHYAYVSGRYNGLLIFDVSTPSAPAYLRTYKPQDKWYETWAVAARADYAYVAASLEGLYLLDVSNPSLPSVTSTVGPRNATGLNVSLSWPYAALTAQGSARFLTVARVDDPAQPAVVGTWRSERGINGVTMSGNRVYVFESWFSDPATDTLWIMEFAQ